MCEAVIDPYELTKDLADRIGIHQLYAIVCDIRGEGCDIDKNKMIDELNAHIEYLNSQAEKMRGEIKALSFAVKCNGVSGNEVQYE